MEQKLYRLLGVNQYRKFVIKVKKKYDQWRGKPDTDNYFLKDYSEEGIVFLKSQLIKNAKIHLVGVLVCLPAILLVGRPWIQVIALLILLHNLYCVMIQRYNLIRINLFYIMPPIPGAPAGIAGASSLIVATTDSVVRSVEATLVAF